MQLINPGASLLVEYGKSESEIKKTIFELNAIQDSVKSVLKIRNKTRRAEELAAFSDSDIFFIREEIFAELQKCGEAALPVFRKMLADESLLKIHGEVIESMAAAGGGKVGNELTSIIREELKFWKETAPRLETGWWNNINDAETENLRNRYSKVLEAIRQLTKLKFAGSRKIVTEFRDFWRSLPQLEDKSGLNQMSEECDDLLKAISSK
jgi:hypothetical protein